MLAQVEWVSEKVRRFMEAQEPEDIGETGAAARLYSSRRSIQGLPQQPPQRPGRDGSPAGRLQETI